MTLSSGILVYILLWWVTLFTVLPWGIKQAEHPKLGHDPGAPVNPRLKRKFLITSLIAAVFWVIAYFVIKSDLLPLRNGSVDF